MTQATVEHVNVTVSDAQATARMAQAIFGWRIRWQGAGKAGGYSVHIGADASYVVAYQPPQTAQPSTANSGMVNWLNHIGVIVPDLDATEQRVKDAGLTPFNHGDYEPGRRFYFLDADGIEWEVVSYA